MAAKSLLGLCFSLKIPSKLASTCKMYIFNNVSSFILKQFENVG
uniref:Uncharacterized protein n=1 Tax=Anguilla anguilla TaxID=7936 RepID=A0A0E9QR30_ANGAN